MNNNNNVISLLAKAKQDKDVQALLRACIDVNIPVFEAKQGKWEIRDSIEIIDACKKAKTEAFQLLKQETYLAADVEAIEAALGTYKSVVARLEMIVDMLQSTSLQNRSSMFIEVFGS